MLTITFRPGRAARPGETHNSGCPFTRVLEVGETDKADIEYHRYTKGFSATAERRYMVTATQVRYGTMKAAVAAIKKARQIG